MAANVLALQSEGVRIERSCRCRSHLPLRAQIDGLLELVAALRQSTMTIRPAATFLTYRCERCKDLVSLTLQDLGLT